MIFDKENFCIQPWIHLATWNDGSVPLCCVAIPESGLNLNTTSIKDVWNSDKFKNARLAFLSGKKIAQCNVCWKEEASGIKSHRIIENGLWRKQLGDEFLEKVVNSTSQDGYLSNRPITLDLRLGNTCNLQCVMCRPRDSSKWLQDSKKLALSLENTIARDDWSHKANSIATTDCFDWFERLEVQDALDDFVGDIQHIIFGGGEPLLIKEHERFIENLVKKNLSKKIKLRYHTNGTALDDKFIDIWSYFKEVELMISLDDWGERNSYIRYPAKWDVISSNLDKLDDSPNNIVINMLTTVHAMNVYNLPEFAMNMLRKNWKKVCKMNNGLFYIGSTHWPQYLSTQVLPENVKRAITDKWNSYEDLKKHNFWSDRIMNQLKYMNSEDHSYRFNALIDYIDKLDNLRPVKFRNIYSEYYELLKGSLTL